MASPELKSTTSEQLKSRTFCSSRAKDFSSSAMRFSSSVSALILFSLRRWDRFRWMKMKIRTDFGEMGQKISEVMITSRWIQPRHVTTLLVGSLAQMTRAERKSILSGLSGRSLLSSPATLLPLAAFASMTCRLSLSLATMCSGSFRWDHHCALSPSSVTNCMQSLIWVSTRDLAPDCGTPRTRICMLQVHMSNSVCATFCFFD